MFYHLHQLWIVSRSLSSTSTAPLVHAFIVNRADHCSSPYYGLPQVRLQPVDGVLRKADRMIGGVSKYGHISDYMPDIIHLLPGHILYRVSSFVWHCFLGIAPTYLLKLFILTSACSGRQSLCSASRGDSWYHMFSRPSNSIGHCDCGFLCLEQSPI